MFRPLRFQVQNQIFLMLPVEGGYFRMGNDKTTDPEAFDDEAPPHEVKVPSFYLAEYPVTQALWAAVLGRRDRKTYFSGDSRPMERVSWYDAKRFLDKLREATEQPFRLPSEAEWEFAARGGVFHSNLKYAGSQRLKEVGWYGDNSHRETKPVGRKFSNELGLYDMSGNVWEWCEDDWHNNYENAPKDGSAWVDKKERGSDRVRRGGGWRLASQHCRSAFRSNGNPGYRHRRNGFRLALSLR